MPTPRLPPQLGHIDDDELERLAVIWRAQALRGDREAFGIAHALEVERRRRQRASQLASLPPEPVPERRWWQFWRTSTRGEADPPAGSKTSRRRLHRGHFAFMRALAQGLDELAGAAQPDRVRRGAGDGGCRRSQAARGLRGGVSRRRAKDGEGSERSRAGRRGSLPGCDVDVAVAQQGEAVKQAKTAQRKPLDGHRLCIG